MDGPPSGSNTESSEPLRTLVMLHVMLFVAGLPFRWGLGHHLTGIRGHYAGLLQ